MVRPFSRVSSGTEFLIPIVHCRIKTQDAIFGELATERLVEIGPAETLTNMASKTVDADYRVQDVALGMHRELLSYNRDAAVLYHDTADEAPANPASTTPQPTTAPLQAPAPAPAPAPTTEAQTAAPPPAAAAVSVPDKALTAQEVITTLVAVGLAKGSSDIPQDQSLRSLCGGT
jgi:fatty acid synthase subunit alpha